MTPLLLALALAAPPKSDLVAAPPRPPVFVPYPVFYPPFWGGGFGPFAPVYYPPQVVVLPQPVVVLPPAPARVEDADRAAAQVPAALTLELPAAADVWLDGVKQSADTRTLSSAPLRIGESFTFRVRARWTESGTTYEAEAKSTVRAGERGKLTVYAGTPVK